MIYKYLFRKIQYFEDSQCNSKSQKISFSNDLFPYYQYIFCPEKWKNLKKPGYVPEFAYLLFFHVSMAFF